MRCILGAGARPANREIPRARALPPEPSRPPTSTRGREVRAAGRRARTVGAPSGLARPLARSLAAGPGAPPALPCTLRTRPSRAGRLASREIACSALACPRAGPISWRSRRAGPAEGLGAQLPHPGLRAPCPRSRRPSLLRPGSVLSDTCIPATSFHLLVPVCFLGYTESHFRFSMSVEGLMQSQRTLLRPQLSNMDPGYMWQ
ncbi:uncharacterized protein LOC129624532 [Bubalus kerabau]|uniref:uncharacterized protein LOC129624532 n=1 Tax=Bubalus carabanensis TaxID=3119969 RepID=UPI000DBC5CD2|nr:uncharacterized protein LOC129624532 [Bubalus carabanensis]